MVLAVLPGAQLVEGLGRLVVAPPAPGPATAPPSGRAPDDTDLGWGDWREADDSYLLENRPPHW